MGNHFVHDIEGRLIYTYEQITFTLENGSWKLEDTETKKKPWEAPTKNKKPD